MHPLDVVKTRFQIQTTGKPGDPNYYTSVFDCMRKMARNEGVLSLYKGVLPPVLVETPKRAVKVIHPFPGTPISYFFKWPLQDSCLSSHTIVFLLTATLLPYA